MRYLLLGDTHNDLGAMEEAMHTAQENGCDRIFQLGDFGYFFHSTENLMAVSDMALEYDMPVDFLDGNHENFDILREEFWAAPDDLFPTEIVPAVTYFPRGYVWEEDGVRLGTFGGAISIDKSRRVKYQSWWPEEAITDQQVNRVLKADERVDIMLCHDVPVLGRKLGELLHSFELPYKLDSETVTNRFLLNQVYLSWQPVVAFHGHYHFDYEEGSIHGLNRNGEMGSHAVIDTESFRRT